MILLYLSILLMLAITRLMIGMRARSLEKQYAKMASEAKELTRQPQYKAGNANKSRDACQAARYQYELGCLVQKRDQIEEKYTSWQSASDRVSGILSAVRGYKGKVLPYALGIIDIATCLVILNMLGVADGLNAQVIRSWVQSWFT